MGVFCQIRLNRPPNGIFTPSSIVSGTIKYALDADMSIEKVTVSLNGSGKLDIVEDNGKSKYYYSNREHFFAVSDIVRDSNQGSVIPTGSYEVKFKFVLPSNIPASFEYDRSHLNLSVTCNIAYNLCIHFKRPKFSLDKKFAQPIVVLRDAQTIPRHPTQLIVHGEKKELSRIFSTGVIYAKVFMSNSIIAPGGRINLDFEVINESKVDVKGVEITLREVLTFFSKSKNFTFKNDIPVTRYWSGSIASGQTERRTVAIDVPIQYNSYDFSKIFLRDFEVAVMIDLPSPHINIRVHVPFQIGLVGMEDSAPRYSEESIDDAEDDESPPSYWSVMNEGKIE